MEIIDSINLTSLNTTYRYDFDVYKPSSRVLIQHDRSFLCTNTLYIECQ